MATVENPTILGDSSLNIQVGSNLGILRSGSDVTLSLANIISLSGIDVDVIGDNGSGSIDFEVSDVKRANLDSSGNLDIEGSLTEGAAL